MRTVEAGDTDPSGAVIRIEPAIEVGNIFKLGTRYSEPLGATYLDEDGNEQFIWMGSYGIGPARILAAAVEQYADDAGISWPKRDRAVRHPPGDARQARRARARRRRRALQGAPDARPRRRSTTTATSSAGEKFADAELLGCPIRLTRRQARRGGGRGGGAGQARAREALDPARRGGAGGRGAVARRPLTARRLFGLDRSGGPPPETLSGAAAAPVDDPERDRLHPPRAAARVPRSSR